MAPVDRRQAIARAIGPLAAGSVFPSPQDVDRSFISSPDIQQVAARQDDAEEPEDEDKDEDKDESSSDTAPTPTSSTETPAETAAETTAPSSTPSSVPAPSATSPPASSPPPNPDPNSGSQPGNGNTDSGNSNGNNNNGSPNNGGNSNGNIGNTGNNGQQAGGNAGAGTGASTGNGQGGLTPVNSGNSDNTGNTNAPTSDPAGQVSGAAANNGQENGSDNSDSQAQPNAQVSPDATQTSADVPAVTAQNAVGAGEISSVLEVTETTFSPLTITSGGSTFTTSTAVGTATSVQTVTVSANPLDSSNAGPNKTGAIAGGVVGGLVGFALLGALIFMFMKRRANRINTTFDRVIPSPPSSREQSWASRFSVGWTGSNALSSAEHSSSPAMTQQADSSIIPATYSYDQGISYTGGVTTADDPRLNAADHLNFGRRSPSPTSHPSTLTPGGKATDNPFADQDPFEDYGSGSSGQGHGRNRSVHAPRKPSPLAIDSTNDFSRVEI